MQDMRPKKGAREIHIPITFDSTGGGSTGKTGIRFGLLLTFLIWVMSVIFVFIASDTMFKWFYPFISLFFSTFIVRFIILGELRFKKYRKELIDNDYMFDHSLFWSAYEIDDAYPHIVSFGNGMKGLFFAFDKDVIVGRDKDNDYNHHEAIADAYSEAWKSGLDIMHIDYMDTVGKDARMAGLFEMAEKAENEDVRLVLTHMYDYVNRSMDRIFATYDVYCFYSMKRDEDFWDDVKNVLAIFKEANYLRYRALDRTEISNLVVTLMNLGEFSVNKANDTMFTEMNKIKSFINPIWVEKNGERTKLAKTEEELKEERRVKTAKKKVKRKEGRLKRIFKKRKQENPVENELDLFE